MKYAPQKQPEATPVSDWLKARDFRRNRLWRFADGVMQTQVGKEWMTAREFDQKFPSRPPFHFYGNPENPDKTKSFMY